MAATVGATLSGVTFALRHSGEGPFISSGGNVYFFGRDSVNTGNVEPHKASDPMSAFTAQTAKTMSSATSTAIEAMACYQVGQVVHCATQLATGAVYYNFYTMDTDTWGLASSEIAGVANTSGFAPTSTSVSLVVRSGGEVVFGFSGGVTVMSGTLNTVYYRRRTGTNTYGTATVIASGTNNYTGVVAALGASDRVHFLYANRTGQNQQQRTLSAANALEASAAAFGGPQGATLSAITPPVSDISGGSTRIRAAFALITTATDQLNYATFTSSDSPGSPSTFAISSLASATTTQANSQAAHALAIDGSTLHYLYGSTVDNDLYYDTDAGTGTFGVDTNQYTGTTLNYVSSNVYTRSGTKYLAMVLDDAATLKYAEITLAAAPPAAAPKRRRLVSRAGLARSNRY